MIATVWLDVPTNFFLGQLFALSAYRQIRAAPSDRLVVPSFLQSSLYALFCFVPVTAYYYYAYTDWSLAYFVDPATVPRYAGFFAVSAYAVSNVAGYVLAHRLIREGRLGLAWLSFAYALALYLSVFRLQWHQYFHIGTYAEYHSGRAVPLEEAGEFMAKLNVFGAILGIPPVVMILKNFWDGRRAAAAPPKAA